MAAHEIAVIPGDGIGPEVMREAVKVLKTIEEIDNKIKIDLNTYDWNSEYYLNHGRMMPKDGLGQLQSHDALLFGALGDDRIAAHIPIWGLIMPIRKHFRQYVNFRPVKQLKGIPTKVDIPYDSSIDCVVIRENAEGEYSKVGGNLYEESDQEIAIQNVVMTKKGIERISRFAFEYAKNAGKTKITNATKSNAIVHTMQFWDKVVKQIGVDYTNTTLEHIYIDALCAHLVNQPEKFEVILASNLFGDILSDLGSALVGGLGISPSANLNPEGDYPSMFEPVHGSAPDIAGKGIANPVAQIWSAALMLEHLGEAEHAALVMESMEEVLAEGEYVTPDLGGTASTEEAGSAVVQMMLKKAAKIKRNFN